MGVGGFCLFVFWLHGQTYLYTHTEVVGVQGRPAGGKGSQPGRILVGKILMFSIGHSFTQSVQRCIQAGDSLHESVCVLP